MVIRTGGLCPGKAMQNLTSNSRLSECSEMHQKLWEQMRVFLLIYSESAAPEELMFPLRPEEGLDEPRKSIRVKTDRQADGQGRASRKRVAKSGPCEQRQGPGAGEGERPEASKGPGVAGVDAAGL